MFLLGFNSSLCGIFRGFLYLTDCDLFRSVHTCIHDFGEFLVYHDLLRVAMWNSMQYSFVSINRKKVHFYFDSLLDSGFSFCRLTVDCILILLYWNAGPFPHVVLLTFVFRFRINCRAV